MFWLRYSKSFHVAWRDQTKYFAILAPIILAPPIPLRSWLSDFLSRYMKKNECFSIEIVICRKIWFLSSLLNRVLDRKKNKVTFLCCPKRLQLLCFNCSPKQWALDFVLVEQSSILCTNFSPSFPCQKYMLGSSYLRHTPVCSWGHASWGPISLEHGREIVGSAQRSMAQTGPWCSPEKIQSKV